MTNPFVHVELNSPDPEKAKTFDAKLFQWQLEDMPNPAVPHHSYTVIKLGEGRLAANLSCREPPLLVRQIGRVSFGFILDFGNPAAIRGFHIPSLNDAKSFNTIHSQTVT